MNRVLLAVLPFVLVGACQRGADTKAADSAASAAQTVAIAAKPAAIDSALPREVELARFREGLGAPPVELSDGFASTKEVVAAFVKRLASRDTAALAALAMTKPEFAWLYYPSSPIGKPPYDLSPGLMYFQFDGNNRKGFIHLLAERSGKELQLVGFNCGSEEQQGDNKVHTQCVLKHVKAPGDTVSEQLFGGIIERHGRFKIINFANKL